MFEHILQKELSVVRYDDIYLQHGLMGYCIFCFWYARKTGNDKYEKLAEQFLMRICKSINFKSSLDIKNGLTGIGIGICFLSQNRYLQGELDYLLNDIDDYLFKIISLGIDKSENATKEKYADVLIDTMIYINFRLRTDIGRISGRRIMELFLIKVLNHVYQNHTISFYEEPLPASISYRTAKYLFALVQTYKLKIYNYRIEHILQELETELLYKIPYCHINRLFLYTVTHEIVTSVKGISENWKEFSFILKKNISIPHILNEEIKDHNMFLTEGLSGVYWLLRYCNRKELNIPYSPQEFYDRFMRSSYGDINSQPEHKQSGIDGYLGLIMVLEKLERYGKHKN